MIKIYIRFYEELNDFLPEEKKKKRFQHNLFLPSSVKDLIESLGVPHTEIDLILVNGKSVDFGYVVKNEDDISVYPVFETLDISNLQHLREKPLRQPKFIVDLQLGKLARYLRLAGFDTAYFNKISENEIIKLSFSESRTILTRNIQLLKRTSVKRGYFVRNTNSKLQLFEVIERFNLQGSICEFVRCLNCNSLLKEIKKEIVEEKLPPKVKTYHNYFMFCEKCNKIFWKGNHYIKMKRLIDELKSL